MREYLQTFICLSAIYPATSTVLWSNDGSCAGWDEILASTTSCQVYENYQYCGNSNCIAAAEDDGSDIELIKYVSTKGYNNINIRYDIVPEDMEGGEHCYVKYSNVGGTNWITAGDYTKDSGDLYGERKDCNNAASDNTNFRVKFETSGANTQDFCTWDNMQVHGTLITSSPTLTPSDTPSINPSVSPSINPSVSPTKTPTSNPTKNPSDNPTGNPTNNPVKDSTRNPTRNPIDNSTKYPTDNPIRSATNIPSTDPTNNPTNPIISPTRRPTVTPTLKPTLTETATATVDSDEAGNTQNGAKEGGTMIVFVIVILFSIVFIAAICFCIVLLITCIKKRKKARKNSDKIGMERVSSINSSKTEKTGEPGSINLKSWLADMGLTEYYDIFLANGFGDGTNTNAALFDLNNDDLRDMGITKIAHRKLILFKIKKVNHSDADVVDDSSDDSDSKSGKPSFGNGDKYISNVAEQRQVNDHREAKDMDDIEDMYRNNVNKNTSYIDDNTPNEDDASESKSGESLFGDVKEYKSNLETNNLGIMGTEEKMDDIEEMYINKSHEETQYTNDVNNVP